MIGLLGMLPLSSAMSCNISSMASRLLVVMRLTISAMTLDDMVSSPESESNKSMSPEDRLNLPGVGRHAVDLPQQGVSISGDLRFAARMSSRGIAVGLVGSLRLSGVRDSSALALML